MASTYYDPAGKSVTDGETAVDTDINNINTAVDNAFQDVESDVTSINANLSNAVTWSEEWANKAEDSLVSDAAGGDQIDDYSALHWANKAADSAASILNPLSSIAAYQVIRNNSSQNAVEDSGINDQTNATAIWLNSSEQVGIGKTPEDLFHVYNSTSAGITIESGGTGDAYLTFELEDTDWFSLGIDNSDSDKFKLSYGATKFSTTMLTIDASNNMWLGSNSAPAQVYLVAETGWSGYSYAENGSGDSLLIQGVTDTGISIQSATNDAHIFLGDTGVTAGHIYHDNSEDILNLGTTSNIGFQLTNAGRTIFPISHQPASAAATGTTGTISWDTQYIYVCVGTDTWKRVAIATW